MRRPTHAQTIHCAPLVPSSSCRACLAACTWNLVFQWNVSERKSVPATPCQ